MARKKIGPVYVATMRISSKSGDLVFEAGDVVTLTPEALEVLLERGRVRLVEPGEAGNDVEATADDAASEDKESLE